MASSYNVNSVVTLGQVKSALQTIEPLTSASLKSISTSGNTIYFYTSSDASGTPAFSVNFPTEFFMDQTKTTFVNSFAFSSSTYPGATNPSLEGKPVLVLAVKGTDGSCTYSFLNMANLVDTYTVASGNSAKILTISGRTITVKISAVTNNAITVQSDGLHVNISGKADKVSGATNNNLASLDSNGNLVDSGIAKSTVSGYATTISGKATKVSSATGNNLAMLTSAGDLADSGIAKSTVAGYGTSISTNATNIGKKATKLTGTDIKENNLLSMTSGGDLKNSGIAVSTVTGYATTLANKADSSTVLSLTTTVSGKATKVSSATANNLAMLTSAGDLADSGIAKSTVTGYATSIAAKVARVTNATTNNVVLFASSGEVKDSGYSICSNADMTAMLTEIFGS